MRQIKFRGKSGGEFIHGNLRYQHVSLPFIEKADDATHYLVDPETVGQYTGLKDKNGKEIFEGDILESGGLILPIHVDDFHGFRFMVGKEVLVRAYAVYGEIIGNIHDNPKLIKINNK
jgi:uncharacterized phage protein (TIGR01671 family)